MNKESHPPTRILVSAGSKHGSTREIAERIGAVLTKRGCDVIVAPPEEISDVSSYAGHWVNTAKQLADLVARSHPPIPTWLFSSGPNGEPPKPDEDPVDVADIVAATSARDHHVFSGRSTKRS